MIEYSIYPNGKRRIVTFSYDDGPAQDERLVALFNQYGVKATFHLNGGKYLNMSLEERMEVRARYAGHEIACHTLQHGWLERMPGISIVNEIVKDRLILEEIAGCPVVGMSYPNGSVSQFAADTMAACGIVYSRTTGNTKKMKLPQDFLFWHPTCHHKDALSLCQTYLDNLDSYWTGPLFYIWGHSYEFRTEADWAYMEDLLKLLSGNGKIWYATNLEICDYVAAQRQLRVSADEQILCNPTATDVWVEKDRKYVICIPAGKTVFLEKGENGACTTL